MVESNETDRGKKLGTSADGRDSGMSIYLSFACWFAGVAYLFLNLKWGKVTDPPLSRLVSALTLTDVIITVALFAAAVAIHHQAQRRAK